MKKLTFNINVLWISTILLTSLSMQGMESSMADKVEEYNNTTCLLTDLPKEPLTEIFSHCLVEDKDQVKSLEKSIKNFMQISMACKKFNDLLTFETIGSLCKNYTQYDKKEALIELIIKKIDSNFSYTKNRLPALILICAGADANTKMRNGECLLSLATIYNDPQTIKALFQLHANPNTTLMDPVFFYAQTVEIAQLFLDNDVNVHALSPMFKTNVIWYLAVKTEADSSSELINLYLAHNVDTKKLSPWDNSCLLHDFAKQLLSKTIKNIADFLKKGELLLNAIPNMINTLNNNNQTPLDIAQKSLEEAQKKETPEAFKQLIALYKKHGGLTMHELTMILLLHNDDHLGNLSMVPRDVRKHIVQYINALHEHAK